MTLHDLHLRAQPHAVARRRTFKSIFEEVGVRHSTVWRAMNGKSTMRPETALRLLGLVRQLVVSGEPVVLLVDGREFRDRAAFSAS